MRDHLRVHKYPMVLNRILKPVQSQIIFPTICGMAERIWSAIVWAAIGGVMGAILLAVIVAWTPLAFVAANFTQDLWNVALAGGVAGGALGIIQALTSNGNRTVQLPRDASLFTIVTGVPAGTGRVDALDVLEGDRVIVGSIHTHLQTDMCRDR